MSVILDSALMVVEGKKPTSAEPSQKSNKNPDVVLVGLHDILWVSGLRGALGP